MAVVVVALVVTYVAAGFAVCLLPPVTRGLASAYAEEDVSPFSREQLVRVADATRDYSFATHDETTLRRTIYDINVEYREAHPEIAASDPGFPNLGVVTDANDLNELRQSSEGASERYCFSQDAVSHLDDCNAIIRKALPALVIATAIGVLGLVVTGMKCRKRATGLVLLTSGAVVLAAFVALGVAAAIDFDGFFTFFHEVFFSQGNWMFSADSLLICALPTEFWMGMGVCWLVTSSVVSLASAIVGLCLAKKRRS